MTIEDREILIENCEVLKEIVECQLNQDEAWRFLAEALQRHFPNLISEYRAARQKGSMFATESNVALGAITDKIQGIIERLKRPSAD